MNKTLKVILGIVAAACVVFMFYALSTMIDNVNMLAWAKQAGIPAIIALLCGYGMGRLDAPKNSDAGTLHHQPDPT